MWRVKTKRFWEVLQSWSGNDAYSQPLYTELNGYIFVTVLVTRFFRRVFYNIWDQQLSQGKKQNNCSSLCQIWFADVLVVFSAILASNLLWKFFSEFSSCKLFCNHSFFLNIDRNFRLRPQCVNLNIIVHYGVKFFGCIWEESSDNCEPFQHTPLLQKKGSRNIWTRVSFFSPSHQSDFSILKTSLKYI